MGARGRDGEASEGVVPGSTNQRQDAIDRHVAPGWCNEFRRGWREISPPLPLGDGVCGGGMRGGGGGGGDGDGGDGGDGGGGGDIERGKAAAAVAF